MDDLEGDYHNFTQSSPAHRLPTLNGAQVLLDAIEKHKPISTGLLALDSVICESDAAVTSGSGGVKRGGVTEVYGAPGSGKTHFAIQLVVNVLRQKDNTKVVWIDTTSELPSLRLQEFLEAPILDIPIDEQATQTVDEDKVETSQLLSVEERFHYLYVASFPHLLSVLSHPTDDLIPDGTILIVIDDFSSIVSRGLPQDERITSMISKTPRTSLARDDIISRSIAARRASMLSTISTTIARLAVTRNLALVVLNKASSNRKNGSKSAMLKSVLSSQQWNENVTTRIVLYRIFWPRNNRSKLNREMRKMQRKREAHALRIAEVERTGGQDVNAEGVRFVILNTRLQAVDKPKVIKITNVTLPNSSPLHSEDNEEAMGHLGLEDVVEAVDQSVQMPEDMPSSPMPSISSQPPKRKITEIADSEGEEEIEIDMQSSHTSKRTITSGFLPSSQIVQEYDELNVSESKAIGYQETTTEMNNENNDMLLKD